VFEKSFKPSPEKISLGTSPGNGKPNDTLELEWAGQLDEVRLSNIARYSTSFTPAERHEPDEHTLALYHFDVGQGDVLTDSSRNGHHGTIHGATWVQTDGTPLTNSTTQSPADAP
jgi:hypothetical protein